MIQDKIVFIGGGNMARSLIGGLIADKMPAEQIHVIEPQTETRQRLAADFGITVYNAADTVLEEATVIILAVKPQMLQQVIKSLSPVWPPQALMISIAAGIHTDDMARWLNHAGTAIVRAMPNTPALVQAGATALFANTQTSTAQRQLAESVMRAVGLVIWVENEQQMDAVTAISGSGPAYFFLVMEAMQAAAMELGLPEETARLLCLETAFGAAKMALESKHSAATLRHQVTSPGGTTERAIHELEDGGLHGLFENAIVAAALRARELGHQLGQDNDT
ncbi:Pyrroline-5-carboxylate reductase [Methylophaga frappieri]|uniref:Pyrroline-5-carboxylate reductase n=1 Tax=Methylophaga frappieri (strain ATCC BAA-2434 / DSM 25690 / JAM7) TaxID=754477 RepID=I1YIN5_METFJ|nr:pyrroline-5-carboxylate reductase [Methylophaga frappieri]AFJ02778.1 Pyrroline-5-carboxylate reductase [Methylophaga frappieri]